MRTTVPPIMSYQATNNGQEGWEEFVDWGMLDADGGVMDTGNEG